MKLPKIRFKKPIALTLAAATLLSSLAGVIAIKSLADSTPVKVEQICNGTLLTDDGSLYYSDDTRYFVKSCNISNAKLLFGDGYYIDADNSGYYCKYTDTSKAATKFPNLDNAKALASNITLYQDGSVKSYWDGYNGGNIYNFSRILNVNNVKFTALMKNYYDTNFFLTNDGHVFVSGNNEYGQTGLGNKDTLSSDTAIQVPGLENIIQIMSSSLSDNAKWYGTIYALDSSGNVYTWGNTAHCATGLDSSILSEFSGGYVTTPTKIPGLSNVKQLAADGYGDLFALTNTGSVYGWGLNEYLGTGNSASIVTPTVIQELSGNVSRLQTSGSNFAFMNDGSVKIWGLNTNSQLGNGYASNVDKPTVNNNLQDITEIDTYKGSVIGIKANGSIYVWGANGSGQLGLGDTTGRAFPTLLSGFTYDWSHTQHLHTTDTTAPTGSATLSPSIWTSGAVTINFTAKDNDGGSGVKSITLPDNSTVTTSTASYKVSKNSTYNFIVTDNSGNKATVPISVSNIDTTAPTAKYSLDPSTNTNGNVTISVTGSDDTSGVKSITLPDNTVTSGSAATFTATKNGNYNFTVTDNAGNAYNLTVPVTNIAAAAAPTIDASVSLAQDAKSATVTTNIQDASGITSQKWASGSQTADYFAKSGTAYTGNTFTVTGNGTYTVYAIDKNGSAAVKTVSVTGIGSSKDTTPPTISVTASLASDSKSATVTTNIQDASGISAQKWASGSQTAVYFAKSGTAYIGNTFTVANNGTYTVYAVDNAGNAAVQTVSVTGIGSQNPDKPSQTDTIEIDGSITASTISVTHPANATYSIVDGKFTAPDITIGNNTDSSVKVTVESLKSADGGSLTFTDAAPDAEDWGNLSLTDSKKFIALGLLANQSTPWASGFNTDTYWAVNNSSSLIGSIPKGQSAALSLTAKNGHVFDKPYTAKHQLVLTFALA